MDSGTSSFCFSLVSKAFRLCSLSCFKIYRIFYPQYVSLFEYDHLRLPKTSHLGFYKITLLITCIDWTLLGLMFLRRGCVGWVGGGRGREGQRRKVNLIYRHQFYTNLISQPFFAKILVPFPSSGF